MQTKSNAGRPDDASERQADRVAEQVTGAGEGSAAASAETVHGVSQSMPEAAASNVASIVNRGTQGGGQPLDAGTRAHMEPRFAEGFADVRVHTDERAAASARSLHADAYTAGLDVVFASGRYAPTTNAGRKLLAHELTHVVQQRGQRVAIQRQEAEPEADEEVEIGIVVYAYAIDMQRRGNGVYVDVMWWYLARQTGLLTQEGPYRPEQFLAIPEPKLTGADLVRRLEAWTTLAILPAQRERLLTDPGVPLTPDPHFHSAGQANPGSYFAEIDEARLREWFGSERWQMFLDGEVPARGGAEGEGRLETETAPLPVPETQAEEAAGHPIRADLSVMQGNRELSELYLLLMQHFTSLGRTPELTALADEGITTEELRTVIGDDPLREHLTLLFAQGWTEFRRAGGDDVNIFGSLIERILEQYTRGNVTAVANRLRVGYGAPERDILGIVHRNNGLLLYDDLGMPLRSFTGIAWRDHGFIGYAVSEERTREGLASGPPLTREREIDYLVANLFAQALGAHDTAMVGQGVSAAVRHMNEVKRRVERGLLPEVLETVGETIGVLILFMLGHALARFLMRSPNPYAAAVGVGIEIYLRGLGYLFGIEFLADTWETLLESAFHLSRVRENEEGVPTALSEVHLDRAAEPVRHLINNTAAAMTFGAFAVAVRGVRRGRKATWGRDWRQGALVLRLLLATGRGVREGIGAESFEGYGGAWVEAAPRVESAPRTGATAGAPEVGLETARGAAETGAGRAAEAAPAPAPEAPEVAVRTSAPAVEGARAGTTEARVTEPAHAEAERVGERLVRVFLAEPEAFDADALGLEHRRAMLDAFIRDPVAYVQAAETDAGDTLLAHLVEEAAAAQRRARGEVEPEPAAAEEAAAIETPAAPETAAQLAAPSPAPLDPATRVTVHLRSDIYYPPGTRYHGETGPQWTEMTLAEAEARGARATRLRPARAAVPSGVYQVERPTQGSPRAVLRAWLGWRQARAGLERYMRSAGEYAVALIQGWQRAHASGAGLGAESGEAIRLAPEFVNQTLQNRGIEQFLRDLRDRVLPEGGQIHVTTVVETHPGTLRLQSIEYRIETVGADGRFNPLADVRIEVTPEGNARAGVRMAGSDTYTYTPEYAPSGEPVRGGSQ